MNFRNCEKREMFSRVCQNESHWPLETNKVQLLPSAVADESRTMIIIKHSIALARSSERMAGCCHPLRRARFSRGTTTKRNLAARQQWPEKLVDHGVSSRRPTRTHCDNPSAIKVINTCKPTKHSHLIGIQNFATQEWKDGWQRHCQTTSSLDHQPVWWSHKTLRLSLFVKKNVLCIMISCWLCLSVLLLAFCWDPLGVGCVTFSVRDSCSQHKCPSFFLFSHIFSYPNQLDMWLCSDDCRW